MTTKNQTIHFLIVVLAILSAGFVVGIDRAVTAGIENIREIQLQNRCATELSTTLERVSTLRAQLAATQDQLDDVVARRRPLLEELRETARRHHLQIHAVKRQSDDRSTDSPTARYNIRLIGSAIGIVRFMRDLETKYVVDLQQAVLESASESGDTASVFMSLKLEE